MNLRRYILLITALTLTVFAFGQKTPVEVKRSNEKIILNGKVYFVHVVSKGETMYSIAKAYNVSQSDIIQSNPTASGGIKTDQVLKIPEAAMSTGEVVLKESSDYRYHIVEQGQTLFSISQKYGTNVDELKKLNPELEVSNIQVNQVIKIPIRKEADSNVISQPTLQIQSIQHQVKADETLFSVSQKYNVSIDEIKKINPDITGDEIKLGQLLLIPLSGSMTRDTTRHNTPGISCYLKSFCDSISGSMKRRPLKISLLMPFYSSLSASDSLEGLEQNIAKLEERNAEISAVSSCFLEFYEGVLIALKALKDEGISVTLNTFDTEKGISYLLALTTKPEFLQSDLIIGPVLSQELSVIQQVCKEKQIPVISPISPKSEFIKDNPLFFQVNPSNNKCFDMIMNYLSGFEKENIIVLLSKSEVDPQTALQADIIRHYFSDTSVVRIFPFLKDSCDLSAILDANRKNIIIVPSKDEVLAGNVLAALNAFYTQYKIEVFGPSNWLSFTAIDLEYLHNLEFTYFTPFYIDYSTIETKKFLLDFRKQYGFEPDHVSTHGFNYAMLGYDIAYQFIKAYNIYGKSMGCCLQDITEKGMMCNYHFVKTSVIDGFQNESGAIIKFTKDFEVKKVMDMR